jgi:hypothetical protein
VIQDNTRWSSNGSPKSGGGTYIHFLRTDSSSDVPGTGSYISVELAVPSGFSGSAAATLTVNQYVKGSPTLLTAVTVTVADGANWRSVV